MPSPVTLTLSVCIAPLPLENVAETLWSWLIVTVQLPVPLQGPPQPVKVWPLPGLAASVTCVPVVNDALQAPPGQLIPAGVELTEPCPVTVTLSVCIPLPLENAAVTLWSWVIASVQVLPLPLQAPLQPLKVAPPWGVAVSVTEAPLVKLAAQVAAPQLRPDGLEVTCPGPLMVTDKLCVVAPLLLPQAASQPSSTTPIAALRAMITLRPPEARSRQTGVICQYADTTNTTRSGRRSGWRRARPERRAAPDDPRPTREQLRNVAGAAGDLW